MLADLVVEEVGGGQVADKVVGEETEISKIVKVMTIKTVKVTTMMIEKMMDL
jgi:hypothetical protein